MPESTQPTQLMSAPELFAPTPGEGSTYDISKI